MITLVSFGFGGATVKGGEATGTAARAEQAVSAAARAGKVDSAAARAGKVTETVSEAPKAGKPAASTGAPRASEGPAGGSGAPKTTVYRVEGAPNTRLCIDPCGNVSIQGNGMLWLNFGNQARAQSFLAQRIGQGMEGAVIKSFEVPTSYVARLRGMAVPESGAKQFPGSPLISRDPYPDQFGLRAQQFDELLQNIIPGSGRVWG